MFLRKTKCSYEVKPDIYQKKKCEEENESNHLFY